MRKTILRKLLAYSCVILFVLQSCKDDSFLTTPPPVADQSFNEEFDTASAVLSRGWQFVNHSDSIGSGVWQNGGSVLPLFNAYSNFGSYVGFIGTDYTCTAGPANTISNWLISPRIFMQNGDRIIFYTRSQAVQGYTSTDTTDFGNTLVLWLNTVNDGTNVGPGPNDNGDFAQLLFCLNPHVYEWHNAPGTYNFNYVSAAQIAEACPTQWTRYEVTVSNLPKAAYRRFAFQYFVPGAGYAGRGTGIGIDKMSYISVNHK
jgi:hypothetical protein